MKRDSLNTLLVVSLSVLLITSPAFARGGGGGGGHGGGGGGGGHFGGGGGGGGHFGGGGFQGGGGHVGGTYGGGGAHFGGGNPGGGVSRGAIGGGGAASSLRGGNAAGFRGNVGSAGVAGGLRGGNSAAGLRGTAGTNAATNFRGTNTTGFRGVSGNQFHGNTAINRQTTNINNINMNNHPQYYRGNWNGNYAGRGYGYGYGGFGGYGGYGGWGLGGFGNGFGYGFGSGLGFGLGSGLGYGLLGGLGGYGWGGYGMGYGGYGMGYGGYGGYGGGYGGYGGYGMGYGGYGTSMGYSSGYCSYNNPYYSNNYGSYGNYSYANPIPVSNPNTATASGPSGCDQSLNAAADAFKQNNYDMALDIMNKGIVQCPTDSVLHEFRALVLFAKGDYQQAASTVHSVLAVGSGWNWTTLSGLYPDVAIYTTQLRALEKFTKDNPQDGASRFLLAYHYLVDGYPDAAATQLTQVAKLTPSDRVATDILKLISKQSQNVSTGAQPVPQPPSGGPATSSHDVQPVEIGTLLGAWHASRNDGSKFDLTLNQDNTFHWKFAANGKTDEFDGTYRYESNELALQRKDGGALIAGVVPDGDKKFNFKLLGAPQEDPGLTFTR